MPSAPGGREPLVIADQGHFFAALRTVTGPAGTSVYGTHVEYQAPVASRGNLVLVHGGGGQAHSHGGGFGWLALSERPALVEALVAIETAGPPYVDRPGLGAFTYGLAPVPLSFGPGDNDAKLAGVPVAVVSAECSGFEPSCRATAAHLRACGASVDEIRLADLGIHGNGHAMMLERNNAEIAAVITGWISQHT